MANNQCLPQFNTKYLKGECQPIGNGGQIFTDNRPTQVQLVNDMLDGYKTNHQLRQYSINNSNTQREINNCNSINVTRCHYMSMPEKCTVSK